MKNLTKQPSNSKKILQAYASMGAAFLAATPQVAEAQIVHMDPPDITVQSSAIQGQGGMLNNLGLDLVTGQTFTATNTEADVNFTAFVFPPYSTSSTWATARNGALGSNGAVVANSITSGAIAFYAAVNFQQGDPIAPGFPAFVGGGVGMNHVSWAAAGGTFRSTGNFKPRNQEVSGYLGVEFQKDGNTHYGWVRVTSNVFAGSDVTPYVPSASLTVHEWAYESTPGVGIPAGALPVEPIPTLSEWGLITLSLIVLSFGTVLIGRREEVVAGQATGNFKIKSQFQRPPFFAAYFKKALIGTAILAAIMAVFSQVVYGGITAVDFFGTMVAGPIFAYLMHLVTAYNDRFKAERDNK